MTNTATPISTAILLVRNPARHDARVLRAARTLRALGYQPLIVASMSSDERRAYSSDDGVPVLRLAPRSPVRWVRDRLARSRRLPAKPELAGPSSPDPGGASMLRRAGLRLHRLAATIDFYRLAFMAVRTHRPVLLHCNDYNTMWVGLIARLVLGTRVIYDAHELWPDRNGRREPRWWLLACEAVFVRVADATVTVSPSFASTMARRYRVPAPTVVRNLPDAPPRPVPVRQPFPSETQSPPVLVYVGGLLRHRGLEHAIVACASLPEVRLRMIGPGHEAYRTELRALAERSGMGERLELAPPVRPDAVVGAIAGATAGVSLFEPMCLSHELTLPNKLFEYLAAGLPVVVSDVVGAASYVREHDVGEVVPAGDPDGIAAGIRRLFAEDRYRICRAHVADSAQSRSWQKESIALQAAYRRAVRRDA